MSARQLLGAVVAAQIDPERRTAATAGGCAAQSVHGDRAGRGHFHPHPVFLVKSVAEQPYSRSREGRNLL